MDSWERALAARAVLKLDAHSKVAIKRDVRQFEISCDARSFALAFADTMADPDRHFGLVQVVRSRSSIGKPFKLGERFQGRFSVARAFADQPLGRRLSNAFEATRQRLEGGIFHQALTRVEDRFTSDYGEITELGIDTLPARVQYVYLEGSYIAGSSTFVAQALDAGRCLLEQIWLYQEIHPRYVKWVGTDVLRMHLAVVHSQVRQASERAGARILRSDIPEAYHFSTAP